MCLCKYGLSNISCSFVTSINAHQLYLCFTILYNLPSCIFSSSPPVSQYIISNLIILLTAITSLILSYFFHVVCLVLWTTWTCKFGTLTEGKTSFHMYLYYAVTFAYLTCPDVPFTLQWQCSMWFSSQEFIKSIKPKQNTKWLWITSMQISTVTKLSGMENRNL